MRVPCVVIFSVLVFSSCDSILQSDRDFSPTLTLVNQNQTDEELIFTFEMHAIENMTSFACEIIFDPEIFNFKQEYFEDNNDNGSYDYGEEFIDCNIDFTICETDEIWSDSLGNGIWNDYTVMYAGYFGALSNFFPISNTETGKISLAAGLVQINENVPMVFSQFDGEVCTINLKINPEINSEIISLITIDSWKLIKENGADIYFGYQVVTDTLLVEFPD